MNQLELEIKMLIIETLDLEEISPDDIDRSAALFGDGLGLDSVDALEIGLSLKKRYGISVDSDPSNMQHHFASIANLAAFVSARRNAA